MSVPVCTLDSFDLIACEGSDAKPFLQSLLSNDVDLLERVGGQQWTALLSPQGRVQAVMLLIQLDPAQYLLAVPYRRGTTILEQLQRFVLRRKLVLRIDDSRHLLGCAADSAPVADALALQPPLSDGRQLYLANASDPYPAADTAWKREDLRSRIPWLPEAAADRHLAHALALDTLAAISLKKGCYPGQEIVARTHYLGRSKRHLVLLSCAGNEPELGPGTQIRDQEDQLAGESIGGLAEPSGTLLLAVLSDDRRAGSLAAVVPAGRRIPVTIVEPA